MNIPILLRTIIHLRPQQIYYQFLKRFIKPHYRPVLSPTGERQGMSVPCIFKPKCWDGEMFNFLNLKAEFRSWNDMERGALWCYNLNYMDWLMQDGLRKEEGLAWIDRFISDMSTIRMGLDPYPIALRSINWVKFFIIHPDAANDERENCLYSQLNLLERKLEYHLLGNHLLEDAYALYIGAVYFKDTRLLNRAERLLLGQLSEQILTDGAHYEQSPMYHCILLDRLLDCINFRSTASLREVASSMLGHLESIVWSDKTIPLFNDAAYGIAPSPQQLFDYAVRLNLSWTSVALADSGYRHLRGKGFEAIIDVGGMTAKYQPGHSHADTFSYELRKENIPIIIDTGISTYNKTARRQYERSTIAHNTVSVDRRNSSEVWGGFRVGGQAIVSVDIDTSNEIKATMDGYLGVKHTRRFLTQSDGLCIKDYLFRPSAAISYIHLAPNVNVVSINKDSVVTNQCVIRIEGADSIETEKVQISKEYNLFQNTTLLKIYFSSSVTYKIEL